MPATLEMQPPPPVAPARPRVRKTTRAVRFVDKLTTTVITGGGIMVIVAVLGIMVFLAAVVVPLFRGAKIGEPIHYQLFTADSPPDLLFIELDEYKTRGMTLDRAGKLTVFDARTGAMIEEQQFLPADARVTAFARTLRGGQVAFGFADGTVRLGRIRFAADGVESRLEDPLSAGKPDVPVALLDYKVSDRREVFTALKADGELLWDEVTRRENILTGKVTLRVAKHELPFAPAATPPAFLLQNTQGDQIYIAWRDGTVRRYDLRRIEQPFVAEIVDLVPDAGAELTDLRFMFGDQSLIASDSHGGVNAWFRVERPEAGTADGYQMVVAHRLESHGSGVTATAMSTRDKGLVTGTADGEIFLRHMTSEQVLGRAVVGAPFQARPGASETDRAQKGAPTEIRAVQLTPKADGIFAVDAGGVAWLWDVKNPHPETTWKTIFGKVWYEGYPAPTFTWQSSSGNDDFEPKFSLVPLIFGTLKATFYSLLFAVPIALLGAIYTSQFLDPRLRAPLKSGIETMASLPSVVLGFVAALVLAPFVENWIVAVLTVFALVPLVALVAGYFWQMLPQHIISRYSGWPQFVVMSMLVIATVLLGRNLGAPVEQVLFHGDFKAWLDGRVGTGAPGIAMLVWPVALLPVWWVARRWFAGRFSRLGRVQTGLLELGKLLGALAVATGLAGLVGVALAGMGVDPRSALLGTYVQRNTFVVGFVMGFAVIPIIYTISEDALSSVPEHLKSASLGCGATRWQTAMRVIVPVAMSGIFSAVMIGLGRAVGETMIVVMAAGNTPLMDINIFNGLRALSANIAVELPEAVRDSTLFRMLFLAALTLFVMTFCVNTLAEIIRMRFRRRAFQL
jgi:phosphate transport system permease protein